LTRALEEKGIGRPSTYASIIDTIQARNYVYKKGNALVPSWTAFLVIRVMEEHFKELVDYEFTAQMEDFLDSISRKELEGRYGPYLTDGETNASLPKTMAPETVTDEIALKLLAERAALGGSKKPKAGRGAKKAAPKKKAAGKKATKKKS
jgi:hypothetical protein